MKDIRLSYESSTSRYYLSWIGERTVLQCRSIEDGLWVWQALFEKSAAVSFESSGASGVTCSITEMFTWKEVVITHFGVETGEHGPAVH